MSARDYQRTPKRTYAAMSSLAFIPCRKQYVALDQRNITTTVARSAIRIDGRATAQDYWDGRRRRLERSLADRKASGISRRDASTRSYKNARSSNDTIGRMRSNKSNRYSSSSGFSTVGSSWPVEVYRPRPLRFRSPSRTSRVRAKVTDERLQSGSAVTISRAGTGRFAFRTYSYTRWMTDLISRTSSESLLIVNGILLPLVNNPSSSGRAA